MNRHRILLAIVLVYAATFRLFVLDRPFNYDAEGSGSLNGVLARSYLRFDWAQNHGMPILSLDPTRGTPPVFYPDHPPLVPLLIVPFYAAFGVGEWQTRLPISLITVGAILALYVLLAQFSTPRIGLIAAAVFGATPMVLYFGGFADVVGTPLLFFVLLLVSAYLRFHRAPGLQTLGICLGTFALAGVCDWPAYVIAPILVVHFVATRPRTEWPWIGAFAFGASAWFVAVYAYITLATHYSWTWMADLFSRRSAIVGAHRYTWSEWLATATAINRMYHTLPLLLIAGLWVAAFGFRRQLPRGGVTIARVLLTWAALYSLIGSKALYDHEWAWCVLTPGLAVASALVLDAAIPGWVTAVALALFASWTSYTTYGNLYKVDRDRPFTPAQTAQAIRLAAPGARDVAMLVGNDTQAQLWFYGDRALRSTIWSVEDFERRLNDSTVDLMFNFDEQPWKARATGIVFPRIWDEDCTDLRVYLSGRYPIVRLPEALAAQFEIFDLR